MLYGGAVICSSAGVENKIQLTTSEVANLVSAVNTSLLLVGELRSTSFVQEKAMDALKARLEKASADLSGAISTISR